LKRTVNKKTQHWSPFPYHSVFGVGVLLPTSLSFCQGPTCYLFQKYTEFCPECQPLAYFWKMKIQSLRLPLQLSLPHSLELKEFRNSYLSICSEDEIKHKKQQSTWILNCKK